MCVHVFTSIYQAAENFEAVAIDSHDNQHHAAEPIIELDDIEFEQEDGNIPEDPDNVAAIQQPTHSSQTAYNDDVNNTAVQQSTHSAYNQANITASQQQQQSNMPPSQQSRDRPQQLVPERAEVVSRELDGKRRATLEDSLDSSCEEEVETAREVKPPGVTGLLGEVRGRLAPHTAANKGPPGREEGHSPEKVDKMKEQGSEDGEKFRDSLENGAQDSVMSSHKTVTSSRKMMTSTPHKTMTSSRTEQGKEEVVDVEIVLGNKKHVENDDIQYVKTGEGKTFYSYRVHTKLNTTPKLLIFHLY